jgi:hypothetical protein
MPTKNLSAPDVTKFSEWVRLFRYWLAVHNIQGKADARIEVHFPDERSQHQAMAMVWHETERLMTYPTHRLGPIYPETFEFEGVKVTFTNPTKWDKR